MSRIFGELLFCIYCPCVDASVAVVGLKLTPVENIPLAPSIPVTFMRVVMPKAFLLDGLVVGLLTSSHLSKSKFRA